MTSHTNNNVEQRIHEIGSTLNQEVPTADNLNNPMTGVAVAGVVAQVEPGIQGATLEPEPAVLHGQGEVIPALASPHTHPLVFEHVGPAQLAPPAPALVPTLAPPVVPAPTVGLDVDLDPDPTQPTIMGSFHGIGGILSEDTTPPAIAAVAQSLAPVADDNAVEQPLPRSLWGFEGIQFEDEDEAEDR
ncbi:hypothetical protein FRC10_005663 [Ceratobasidium sp. 414]|nr:hypothetical protein FRC10_005663 [Ceratobasidium sp. 414]